MRYGFTKGGFVVVDDVRRIGEFAYATSQYWDEAKRRPEATAQRMLAKTWAAAPDHIREQHYLMSCNELAAV
jgi:hypothetical protein